MTTEKMNNLLSIRDLDPPMGDLAAGGTLDSCRSLWTKPLPEEADAPRQRIIHARVLQPHETVRISRVGITGAPGLHKCGSRQEPDWITELRILSQPASGEPLAEIGYWRNLPELACGDILWLDLAPFESCGLSMEIRRCGVDDWWSSWNLAAGAFVVEGEETLHAAPRREYCLSTDAISLNDLPAGLSADIRDGQARFRSRYLEVGFCLGRPGLAHLGLDQEGKGATQTNLLKITAAIFQQGLFLHEVGQPPTADRAVRFRFQGRTTVEGNRVSYALECPQSGQRYRLCWTVGCSQLELEIERNGARPVYAWESSAWTWALQPSISVPHAMGIVEATGQTGLLRQPALLHFPGHASLRLQSSGTGALRVDTYRPCDRCDWEFKVGEVAQADGRWMLEPGTHRARWEFTIAAPEFPLKPEAPAAIRNVLRRAGHTGMSFRPDIGSLSNSGASMLCPISMDTWAAQAVRMGEMLPGMPYHELVRQSLERWLLGGPGYASGRLKADGNIYSAEDEYLMTAASALMGLAEYLGHEPPPGWLENFENAICWKLDEMAARDLDADGLVESPYRTGVSGSGHWSTCWFDVVTCGWKDAFSNAILYEALQLFLRCFEETPLKNRIPWIADWIRRLHENYRPAFFNPETGWLAAWRCREDRLHDYAFLPANGAAVAAGLIEPVEGARMLRGLLAEIKRVGMPSACYGLPGNLWPFPDENLAEIMRGYPFGYYQNGGRTHAQTRHFLRGLYRAGLQDEADELLEALCRGMAEMQVFGGVNSGFDWRYWDDRPCGYEGLLTDQFGFLAVALERYR